MTFTLFRRGLFVILLVLISVSAILFLNSNTSAQPSGSVSERKESASNSEAIKTLAESNLELARQQFDFQKAIENEKLKTEKLKAWLTGGSILLPLMIGVLGAYWQIRSAFTLKAKDLESARQLKELEVKNAFELKAVEIALNNTSPGVGVAKAKALSQIFPHRLPEDFVSKFEPIAKTDPNAKKHFSYEDKLELIRLLASNSEHEKEIIQWWGIMFPWHKWFLEEKFSNSKSTSEGQSTSSQPTDAV